MASFTCENHPDLVWSAKDMCVHGNRYAPVRSIFFFGRKTERFSDGSGWNGTVFDKDADGKIIGRVQECDCPPSKLILLHPETGEIVHS